MLANLTPLAGRIYHAVPGFEDHLFGESEKPQSAFTVISPALFHDPDEAPQKIFWHQNCWLEPQRLEFSSINEATRTLRGIQRNWAACLHSHFRRGALIASKLPPISAKPRPFPWQLSDTPMGAWTLLDEHTIIASAHCSSPFPGGAINFAEDREGPPSRAYLKLWEALVLMRRWPAPGERCLDAGASPGGWSWALAQLGAQVIAVDRSPLEGRIATLPGIAYISRDAFSLKPMDIGPIDWLFCDVACYPPKLYAWIEEWLCSGLCRNFVCTIKMTDKNLDFATPRRFAAIPGSSVVHLYHNKHELTWMYSPKNSRIILGTLEP